MLHVKAKRVNPMSSCHKGNIFVVNAVCIWGDGCSLNLLRQSFHDLCKSECYTVHLKLIQCYMSIVLRYNLEKINLEEKCSLKQHV